MATAGGYCCNPVGAKATKVVLDAADSRGCRCRRRWPDEDQDNVGPKMMEESGGRKVEQAVSEDGESEEAEEEEAGIGIGSSAISLRSVLLTLCVCI